MTGARLSRVLLAAASLLVCGTACADDLRVAVASNFAGVLQDVARRFEAETGHRVILSAGSTGKHHAQIVNGAPFDVFFAADAESPARLERDGHAVPGSRFTYAVGRLVLWSPEARRVDGSGDVLRQGRFRFLAIANPHLAPYGRAARETLENLGLWQSLQTRLVRGENVSQAYQFVHSGNAELGLVAWSQIMQGNPRDSGSSWLVPQALYQPLTQQAVVLRETPAARAFMDFIRSEEALCLLEARGYLSPPVARRRAGN